MNSSESEYINVLKIYSNKNTREESFNAIIECESEMAERFLNARKISVAWDMCRVFTYVRLMRCFKCLGFNHLATNCKKKIACNKCGGEHKVEECQSNEMACISCVEHVKNTNEDIPTNHHAFAHNCWCTQQMIERASKKTHDKSESNKRRND